MATYTKQPLTVEARPYTDSASGIDIANWVNADGATTGKTTNQTAEFKTDASGDSLKIYARRSTKTAAINDFCILDEDGKFSFLATDKFNSKYTQVI